MFRGWGVTSQFSNVCSASMVSGKMTVIVIVIVNGGGDDDSNDNDDDDNYNASLLSHNVCCCNFSYFDIDVFYYDHCIDSYHTEIVLILTNI
jgi:hypothetical protein